MSNPLSENETMNQYKTQLEDGLAAMQIDLPAAQQDKLLAYLALLGKWNGTYNLTALRSESAMISRHLLDSLTLLPYLEGAASLTDVGSGGGMPGIPAAICRPDIRVILIDSNTKKTTFLQQAVIELDLPNATVLHGRVEALHDTKSDVVTSRAFAELRDFIALTKHLLNPGGRWAAMKGVYPYEELENLPADVEVTGIDKLTVPTLDADRHMVLMRPKGSV